MSEYLRHMASRAELVAHIEALDERCERYQKLLEECRAILGPQWPPIGLVDVPGRFKAELAKGVKSELRAACDRERCRRLQAEADTLRVELHATRIDYAATLDSHRVERLFRELARAGREATVAGLRGEMWIDGMGPATDGPCEGGTALACCECLCGESGVHDVKREAGDA